MVYIPVPGLAWPVLFVCFFSKEAGCLFKPTYLSINLHYSLWQHSMCF